MKKERFMNLAGVLVFYLIIVLGVVALNARMEYLNGGTNVWKKRLQKGKKMFLIT